MNLYEAALQIATEAHKGQTRDNGEPYITHPIAVAKIIGNDLTRLGFTPDDIETEMATAVLHDVVEDTELSISDVQLFLLRAVGCSDTRIPIIIYLLRGLTRNSTESYVDYILNIKHSNSPIAITVKLADLQHNLSDHKPGARRDKYELAAALLKA